MEIKLKMTVNQDKDEKANKLFCITALKQDGWVPPPS